MNNAEFLEKVKAYKADGIDEVEAASRMRMSIPEFRKKLVEAKNFRTGCGQGGRKNGTSRWPY